jgi:outer membrane protein assembly factor BamB
MLFSHLKNSGKRHKLVWPFVICLLFPSQIRAESPTLDKHPLMPGVQSAGILSTDWPVSFHDQLVSGFSPLTCGMNKSPKIWSEFHLGGKASEAVYLYEDTINDSLNGENGTPFLLVKDSRLRRIDSSGKEVWSIPSGAVLFYQNLHGEFSKDFYEKNGFAKTLGVQQGNALLLVNPNTGKIYWKKQFQGSIGPDKIRVAKTILPNPGKQIFVFPKYCDQAYCYGFLKGKLEPVEIWKTEAGVRDWQTEADHGVSTIIEPDGTVIWNVRHHTINMHDVLTGKWKRRFEFKIKGQFRRNYGPTVLGNSKDGTKLIGMIGQKVQDHISCFTRSTKESHKEIFHHYIGEVYRDHGIQLWLPVDGLGDVNGDSSLDFVYSRRIIDPEVQTQTVICEAGTGQEKIIKNSWIAGIVDLDHSGKKTIFAYSDPKAEMTRQGYLQIYQLDQSGNPVLKKTFPNTELILATPTAIDQPENIAWCIARLETAVNIPLQNKVGKGKTGVLIRDYQDQKIKLLSQVEDSFHLQALHQIPFHSEILCVRSSINEKMLNVVVQLPDGSLQIIPVSLSVNNVSAHQPISVSLKGGGSYLATASDLTGDGACELLVTTPNDSLNVYTFNSSGKQSLIWRGEFKASEVSSRLGAVVADLNSDGQKNVVGFGESKNGKPTVILYDQKGNMVWNSVLPMPDTSTIVKWTPGNFFGPSHAGIFISVQQGQTLEVSFMLNGKDGRIVWKGNSILLDRGTRAMNPLGMPAVYDADGDGKEDLLLDYRDYMSIVQGSTGKHIQKPINVGGEINEWIAYNSLLPVYKSENKKPHFLVMLGYGGVGLFQNDFQTNEWYHDLDYHMPQKVGMIDVDGDGELEIGYENNRDGWFTCKNLWTGKEKWRIKLPGKGYGPVISADFDGDGKGEFLIGGHCIGTDSKGKGEIRWKIGTPGSRLPVIADFNGDGIGELAMPAYDGTVRILKGK